MANSEIKMSMSLATAGVTTALGKAKAGVADFSDRSMEKLKSVAAFFKTGLIVGAGFLVGMKKSIDRMTEMSRAADRLGVSTEMFQKLAHAAAQTGVATDRLADAMKDLDVKLQDGIMRGGSFAELMQELGLDMQELAKMPAAERFLTFSDAIKKATGSLSRFGADEFGDAMFELLPLLEQGSEGILELGSSATIATDEQIKAAARASAVIEKMSSQFSGTIGILVSELYQMFEVFVAGATQAAIEIADNYKLLGKVIISALNPATWLTSGKAAFDELKEKGSESWGRVKDAMNETIDEQLAAGKKVDAQSSAMTAEEIARLKKSGDERKKNADSWQKSIEKSASLEKKAADEREKRESLSLSTQDKIIATQEKIAKLREEISQIDPFEDKGQVERAEKELEIEKLLTDEVELQGDLAGEAAEADEAAIEAKMNKLDLELQLAKASGDPKRIAAAQKELDTETQIVALMNQHKIGREEATKILGDQNAHLDRQKNLEFQLLQAQANGNDALARELQGRIDKEQEALDLMDDFKMSIEDATALAEKLAAVRAGPDLNQSGFVTPKEQKEFDRQQKERQKQQDEINQQELRDERQRGGGIPNVSNERRITGTISERMAASKEKAARIAANRAINKQGDEGVRKQMVAAEDARRAAVAQDHREKFGGDEVTKPMTNLERQKAKNEALKERRAAKEKPKEEAKNPLLGPDGKPVEANGNHMGPGGVMVGPNGEPLGPGGKPMPGAEPKEPKKPDAAADKSLGKLDKIITELGAINKSLKC